MPIPRLSIGLLWLAVPPALICLVIILRDVPFIWGLAAFAIIPVLYAILQRFLRLFEIDNLTTRAVFITGCDTGFGHQLALKCVKRGVPVFAGCLTEQGAESLRAKAVDLTGKLETIIIDIGSDESVTKAAEYLNRATVEYGGLHGIVNNAGIVGHTFFDDLLDIDQYKAVVEVNTFGAIRVTQALKHLVKKTRGRIVTVSSAAGRVGFMGMGPYTVSKFAVSGYCEVIRQELRYFGVSVHVLEPGMFRTPICSEENIKARFDQMWSRAPASVKDDYGEDFYLKCGDKISGAYKRFGSDNINEVVDAYFHALFGRFPSLRYQLGWDCKLFVVPLSYLPTGFRDAILTVLDMIGGSPIPKCAQRGDEPSRSIQ